MTTYNNQQPPAFTVQVNLHNTVFTDYSPLYNRLYNRLYEPSQVALERSSQDAYDVINLTRSKAAVLTVDDVARLTE